MVDIFFCALRSLGKLCCKVVSAYLHVGVSIVYARVFKVGCSRHFPFTLATQNFGLSCRDLLWRTATVAPRMRATRPPTLPPYLFVLNFLILLCLRLGRRESNFDQSKCFRCHRLGHWARDCCYAWLSQGGGGSNNASMADVPGFIYKCHTG